MIKRFSREPYLKRKAEKEMILQNKLNFEREKKQRERWRTVNKFNDKPRLDLWDKNKKKAIKQVEDLILSNIGFTDGTQTAVTNMKNGLGLRELDFDFVALEDLVTNIYLVKLADVVCSDLGAKLKEDDRNLVLRAVIGQLFPQPAPISQAQVKRNSRTDELVEGIAAVRSQGRRF